MSAVEGYHFTATLVEGNIYYDGINRRSGQTLALLP